MKRRSFIVLAGAAAAWPSAGRAQTRATPRRIGVLLVGFSADSKAANSLRQGLQEAGYTEGRNAIIEWRFAQGDYSRVPALIDDLIQRNVEVIVHDSTVGTAAAKRATSTIPNVMALVLDPVGSGLVSSLAKPGGNVTGLSMMTTVDLNSKRLQLLKEMTPGLARASVIWNPDHPLHVRSAEELKGLGPRLAVDLTLMPVRTRDDLAPAFSQIKQAGSQAVYVIDDPIFFTHRTTLLELAAAARLPTIHDLRRFPEAGALMSYGPDVYDLFRRSAAYVDRIFKGARPSDLPVEQPTKFELVINQRTAKALGIEIPLAVLYRADEVIE